MSELNLRSARLNMRITPEALEDLKSAAALNNQDVSSFVLSAALNHARDILIQERVIKLSPHAIVQLEKVLEAEAAPIPALASLFVKYSQPQTTSS